MQLKDLSSDRKISTYQWQCSSRRQQRNQSLDPRRSATAIKGAFKKPLKVHCMLTARVKLRHVNVVKHNTVKAGSEQWPQNITFSIS